MDAAEFDQFADEYDRMHEKSIAVTGEKPEFFHEYKINALVRLAQERNLRPDAILDFGYGIGNSTTFFRRNFPAAKLSSADVSQRSLDVAESRFAGMATSLRIEDMRIPADSDSFSIAFSACVFHHIPHEEHVQWLRELHRITRPGGMLAIFEHNPMNPLTVRSVNQCPFDENAHLIKAKEFVARCSESGWKEPKVHYHLFFPHALSGLRRFEPHLSAIPFGGQYSVTAIKSD
jgi:ubiquinone/menaquinone biosynthesis C-methylase UbiE